MNNRILVIADLRDASPRIPGLTSSLADLGWQVDIVTPSLGIGPEDYLGFPEDYLSKVRLIQTLRPKDNLEVFRSFLSKFGQRSESSYLEQTKRLSSNRIYRRVVGKAFSLLMSLVAIPDLEFKWRAIAIEAANLEFHSNTYSLIFSSSPFPTSHIVASQLQKKFGTPWVADYRDPWSNNPVYIHGRIRKFIDTHIELFTMKNATIIISVSSDYANSIAKLLKKEVRVVPNGFIDYPSIKKTFKNRSAINILHTGNLYFPQHDLSIFFDGMDLLLKTQPELFEKTKVSFYGRFESEISQKVELKKLENVITQHGRTSRKDCIELQKNADVLLFFGWQKGMDYGLSHLKFYEYLNSGAPIFFVGESSDNYSEVLEELNAGFQIRSPEEFVARLKQVFDKGSFSLDSEKVRRLKIERFSYRARALDLEKIFLELIPKRE